MGAGRWSEGLEKSRRKTGFVLRTDEGQGGLQDVRRLRLEQKEREPQGRQTSNKRHHEVRAEVQGRGWGKAEWGRGFHGGAACGAASGPLQVQARR